MKIVINGIHANLRFASAHMIPLHESCGGIHGHSYIVDLVIEGERSGEFGFVVDFKQAKNTVRSICKKLDHKVLIPYKSDVIEFVNKDKNSLEFIIGQKEYKLPIEDCCILPIKSTSAEDLAEYFAKEIFKYLEKTNSNISRVQVCVNEGIGQGAYYEESV